MMRSLYSGVSGLQAHQSRMDVIGNNIANVNTVGYKKDQVTFQDMLYQTVEEAKQPDAGGDYGGTNSIQTGIGVTVGAITTIHTQGAVSNTGNTTDLMVQGEGYFMLKRGSETYYSRAGAFIFDNEGYLVNSANGMYVLDENGNNIQINNIETAQNIKVASNGDVTYIDSAGDLQTAATLGLAKFANPAGLDKLGENMYQVSDNSGDAIISTPGNDGSGVIVSGVLEMSNVDLAAEFADMIITQRGFQANSRTIRTTDEMLQELINLRR